MYTNLYNHTYTPTYIHAFEKKNCFKQIKNFEVKKLFEKKIPPDNRYVGMFPREWYYSNAFFHIFADHVN